MKKGCKVFVLLCLLCSVMWTATACMKDELQEGTCGLEVTLTGLPENAEALSKGVWDRLYVTVQLFNPQNEKRYTIALKYEEGYQYTAKLHPGTYEVTCSGWGGMFAMEPVMQATEITLTADATEKLELQISAEDTARLAQQIALLTPTEAIKQADKYSRQLQIGGEVVALQEMLAYIDPAVFTAVTVGGAEGTMESVIPSGQKAVLQGSGISVTVYNGGETEQLVTACKVIEVTMSQPYAVFPGGVLPGVSAKEIAGKEGGYYGTPTSCSGSLLLGFGIADTTYRYSDGVSGDLIKLEMNSDMEVRSITYMLEQFAN